MKVKNEYNNELILDDTSLVFIDPKTKGCKSLEKLLTERNIKWVNLIENNVTHSVCTRYACDKLDAYVDKYNHYLYINYNRSSHEKDQNWPLLKDKKIYSYNEFMYLLNNSNRTSTEYSDKIIMLLKSCDQSNVELAIVMMDNYTVDERWIPWLKMNAHLTVVRAYLRKLNIKFGSNPPRKSDLIQYFGYQFDKLNVSKEYRSEFLNQLLDE